MAQSFNILNGGTTWILGCFATRNVSSHLSQIYQFSTRTKNQPHLCKDKSCTTQADHHTKIGTHGSAIINSTHGSHSTDAGIISFTNFHVDGLSGDSKLDPKSPITLEGLCSEQGIIYSRSSSSCSMAVYQRNGKSSRLRIKGNDHITAQGQYSLVELTTMVKGLISSLAFPTNQARQLNSNRRAVRTLAQDLLRITSICFRVINALRKIPQSSLANPLTPGDLNKSLLYWVRATQAAYFSTDMDNLLRDRTLPSTHPFTRLTAFIDNDGILRVGGRLKHSNFDVDYKNSMILPRQSTFTTLIIQDAHSRTLHGGTQLTLSYIRKRFWIIGGRQSVKSYILKCVPCARERGLRAQQLMGQLPLSRITPSRPFLTTGVDYAGPISIKAWKGRGANSEKGWICIFVCFSTSAIHLEVVSDYSTHGFIAAFRRFTRRRGICHTLYSDCGKNLEGADNELKRLFQAGTQSFYELSHLLSNDGTTWKFNPLAAAHMGGKWEAGVKSVKFHLRRTIGETKLSYEEFTTLLVQIEAVLNSRPLEQLSDDPDDFSTLTPSHFLIGDSITTIPEPSLINSNISPSARWKLIQQRFQFFWSKWSSCYLQRQQSISKWHHPLNQLKVGSMVLLTDERFPPAKWPLARILELHPGTDGLTRVVTIKTATSTFKRSIHKLAPLPIDTDDSNQEEN